MAYESENLTKFELGCPAVCWKGHHERGRFCWTEAGESVISMSQNVNFQEHPRIMALA